MEEDDQWPLAYEGVVTDEAFAEPFDALMGLRDTGTRYTRRRRATRTSGVPKDAAWRSRSSTDLVATALSGGGSSKAVMVEVAGIEPASFGYETGLLRVQPAFGLLGPDNHAGELSPGPVAVRCP